MFLPKQASVMLLTTFIFSGCISAPPKKPNIVEQVKQENEVGSKLAKDFEAQLHFKNDAAIEAYLQKVGKRLEKSSGDPRLENTQISMIQEQGPLWRSFSLPGRRVYLSIGWLKKVQTDSELAALIALELGRIQQKQVLSHMPQGQLIGSPSPSPSEKKKPEFFGEKGLFTYNQKETEAALASAVGILYKAGFDSRGLVSNLETEKDNLEHSIYTEFVLNGLIEVARDDVDSFPPLINPIVRTREFANIRKRIKNL
jgi:predicted Zn-dependent protease